MMICSTFSTVFKPISRKSVIITLALHMREILSPDQICHYLNFEWCELQGKSNQIKNGLTSSSSSYDDIRDVQVAYTYLKHMIDIHHKVLSCYTSLTSPSDEEPDVKSLFIHFGCSKWLNTGFMQQTLLGGITTGRQRVSPALLQMRESRMSAPQLTSLASNNNNVTQSCNAT